MNTYNYIIFYFQIVLYFKYFQIIFCEIFLEHSNVSKEFQDFLAWGIPPKGTPPDTTNNKTYNIF